MNFFPSKSVTACVALISLLLISLAFTAPPERKYKNLKILSKNIGEKELDSIMHKFTDGLGVKCNFCHVRGNDGKWDHASDEKPEKNIARKMMRMTTKINKKYFEYAKNDEGTRVEVLTCYSCHHGQAHPARNPPPRQRQQNPADSTARQQQ